MPKPIIDQRLNERLEMLEELNRLEGRRIEISATIESIKVVHARDQEALLSQLARVEDEIKRTVAALNKGGAS